MRIPRIYTAKPLGAGRGIVLEPEASQHLGRALRLQAGDSAYLFDGSGAQYLATITSVEKKCVTLMIGSAIKHDTESPLVINLGVAISRGDRMDLVVQKATELGVAEITPLFTERTEVKLSAERALKKCRHWQHVIISACEQCGRNRLPKLHSPESLGQWLPHTQGDRKFVLHHRNTAYVETASAPTCIDLLIGPEGGLTQAEINLAHTFGFEALSLGPRILRTETAPLAALAILQARWGDMDPGRQGGE
jgi:16S rRNA (uracil1498-N3)-methyltransferase